MHRAVSVLYRNFGVEVLALCIAYPGQRNHCQSVRRTPAYLAGWLHGMKQQRCMWMWCPRDKSPCLSGALMCNIGREGAMCWNKRKTETTSKLVTLDFLSYCMNARAELKANIDLCLVCCYWIVRTWRVYFLQFLRRDRQAVRVQL